MSAPLLLLVGMDLDTDFITAADGALRKVLQACQLYLIPPFLSVALLYTVGRGYLQGGQLRMDFSPLLKALFVYFILFFYRDFMDLIGGAIGAFSSLVAPSDPGVIARALQGLTNPAGAPTVAPDQAVNTAGFVNDQVSNITSIWDKLTHFSLLNLLTELFTTTTVALIRQLLVLVRQYVVAFLYVSGPIAICLSALPPFAQLGKQWLQNFMAVQFWSLTYSLLDTIYANYAATRPATGNVLLPTGMTSGDYGNDLTYLINSIGFVILYCMVPWLTSFLIGSSAVQGFVGMFSGAVAGAAGAVSGVVFPGAYGGGASGALGRKMGFGPEKGSSTGGSASSAPTSSASVELPTMSSADTSAPTRRRR
ncbi:conjugal transfer protein TraG [Hymenobacter jeollabukensis]|uniref:Conjugal transfer protein TraG n=1 Tax=Hymenobacter jeollabukensis TaxID=2025313 RepID=A0A5R8WHA2_9BACT|nr:conjugal transfer protein TraG [Hymenobacter jeollabukensis]TLM87846.1 conjugal transfer protein TraG [Hymenobacter jeollabukensis]